jgi:hypothetical protein
MAEPSERRQDPADRRESDMVQDSDDAGVPRSDRAGNAGGTMSETIRSRDPDLDDEVG